MIKEEDLKEKQPRLLTVDNEVVVPVNKVVKVLITANDVLACLGTTIFWS